ncbi:MAG: SGNH/GDSL hydrolase family protein [Magnetococcales bacterium]|nr:SGNH/GDSL hydrolase family protein [Magnetococcales bacterium]
MQQSSTNALFTSILVIASIFICLVVAELGLRLVDFSFYWPQSRSPDPITGWSAKPGTKGWQRIEGAGYVEINSDGWRDVDHSIKPKKGSYRIAVIGDSFTEAVQIDLDDSYWRLLEKLLPQCVPAIAKKDFEIIGFGVSGYSTAQELLVLENRVWKYQPDLIVLGFFTGNDLLENSRVLGGDAMRPVFDIKNGVLHKNMDFLTSPEYLAKSSMFGRFEMWVLGSFRLAQAVALAHYKYRLLSEISKSNNSPVNSVQTEPGIDVAIYAPPIDKKWRDTWELTEALLKRMYEEVENHGAKFLLVTMTNGAQVHPYREFREQFKKNLNIPNLFYADERIKQIGIKYGFDVLNLGADLQRFASETGVWLHGFKNSAKGIGHWNENGHLIASQRIASYLCYNHDLITK